MRQHSLRIFVTGWALVVVLTLAGAAPAHASGPDGSLWSWLAGLWSARIATPWIGTGQAQGGHRHPGTATAREKAGSCVDPNGCGQTLGTAGVNDSGSAIGFGLNPHG